MHASDHPSIPALFQHSVLAWRASYLAEKALRQHLPEEDKPAETEEAVDATPLRIVKPRRFAGRRRGS